MKIRQFGTMCFAVVTLLLLSSTTRADIVINFSESGGFTTATISGSVDLSLLGTPSSVNNNQPTRYIWPTNAWFSNATSSVSRYSGTTFSPTTGYGTGGFATTTGIGTGITGQTFGFYRSNGLLEIQSGYVSNSPLNGSLIVLGTIASLGIDPFTQYSISRTAGGGTGVAQTITLQTSAIPEPSCLGLLGFGLVGFALRRRRKLA